MSDAERDATTQDPFWSAFSSRHPDVRVVLQREPTPQLSPGSSSSDPQGFMRSQSAVIERLWDQLVGESNPRRDTQWIPGPTRDSARCSLTLTLDEVSERRGLDRLRNALDVLSEGDWQVFAPPTGLPRIHADRRGTLGAEEMLFGYAPETERLFLRLRSTGLAVGEKEVRALLGETDEQQNRL